MHTRTHKWQRLLYARPTKVCIRIKLLEYIQEKYSNLIVSAHFIYGHAKQLNIFCCWGCLFVDSILQFCLCIDHMRRLSCYNRRECGVGGHTCICLIFYAEYASSLYDSSYSSLCVCVCVQRYGLRLVTLN